MGDEAVALRWLTGAPFAWHLECCQETIYLLCVVLDQLYWAVKLGPIQDGDGTIHMSGNDVVVVAFLQKGEKIVKL